MHQRFTDEFGNRVKMMDHFINHSAFKDQISNISHEQVLESLFSRNEAFAEMREQREKEKRAEMTLDGQEEPEVDPMQYVNKEDLAKIPEAERDAFLQEVTRQVQDRIVMRESILKSAVDKY